MSYIHSLAHGTILCADHGQSKIVQASISDIWNKIGSVEPIRVRMSDGSARLFGALADLPLSVRPDGTLAPGAPPSDFNLDRKADCFHLSIDGRYLCAERSGGVSVGRIAAQQWESFSAVSERHWAQNFTPWVPPLPGWSPGNARLVLMRARKFYGAAPLDLTNARVTATDWSVISPDRTNFIPNMSHIQRYNKNRNQRSFSALQPSGFETMEYGVLIGGYYNFYHHILDYTINLFSNPEIRSSNVPLLLTRPVQKFQQECLDVFDLHRPGNVYLDPMRTARVRRLHVPEKAILGDGHVHNRGAFDACRRFLLGRLRVTDVPRRIFISRKNAAMRRAANEDAAIELCASYGYRPVILEDLTLADQISLFLHAEGIVGLHGAGLTHMAFAPPGCRVIEIGYLIGRLPNAMRNIATGLDHDFSRVSAHNGGKSSTTLEIDLVELRDALDRSKA